MHPPDKSDSHGLVVPDWRSSLIYVFVALFVATMFFLPTLIRPPGEVDELVMWAAAEKESNPFIYFYDRWILGNPYYRPLTSLSIWLPYKLWGPAPKFQQFINVFFQAVNTALVFRLAYTLTASRALSSLLSIVFLTSLFSFSASTWIGDRTNLFVGTSLLLVLNHLWPRYLTGAKISFWYLFSCCFFALLAKESGIAVVVTTALAYLITQRNSGLRPWKAVASFAALSLVYLAGRRLAIGPDAFSGSEDSFFHTLGYAARMHELTGYTKILGILENAIKNGLAVILPVFYHSGIGGVHTSDFLFLFVGLLSFGISTISLLLVDNKTRLVALVIIFLNGIMHFTLFRYRNLYLGQIGWVFLLTVAYSSIKTRLSGPRLHRAVSAFVGCMIILGIYGARKTWMRQVSAAHHQRAVVKDWVENPTRFPPDIQAIIKQIADSY